MARQAITSINIKTVVKGSRGSTKAGSMRASTAGTNSKSGAARSAVLFARGRPNSPATSGAAVKKDTKMAQDTSAGTYAPGEYEYPSQQAMTASVATAPATCRRSRLRTTATTNNPASTRNRKPNSNQG